MDGTDEEEEKNSNNRIINGCRGAELCRVVVLGGGQLARAGSFLKAFDSFSRIFTRDKGKTKGGKAALVRLPRTHSFVVSLCVESRSDLGIVIEEDTT